MPVSGRGSYAYPPRIPKTKKLLTSVYQAHSVTFVATVAGVIAIVESDNPGVGADDQNQLEVIGIYLSPVEKGKQLRGLLMSILRHQEPDRKYALPSRSTTTSYVKKRIKSGFHRWIQRTPEELFYQMIGMALLILVILGLFKIDWQFLSVLKFFAG